MRAGRKKQLKLNKGVFIVSKYIDQKLWYLSSFNDDNGNFVSDIKWAKKYKDRKQAEWVASFFDGAMVESI